MVAYGRGRCEARPAAMFWHAAGWVRRPGGEAEMPVGRFPGLVVRWGPLWKYMLGTSSWRLVGIVVGGRTVSVPIYIYLSPGGRCGVGFDRATPIT